MKSQIQYCVITLVSLTAFSLWNQAVFSQVNEPAELTAIERDLASTLEQISAARASGQSAKTLQKTLDTAFANWSVRVVKSDHHFAGWPNEDAEVAARQRVEAADLFRQRLESLCRMLTEDRAHAAARIKTSCELLAKAVAAQVVGLPLDEEKELKKRFAEAKSPTTLSRAIVRAQLYVAKNLVNKDPQSTIKMELIVRRLDRLSSNDLDAYAARPELSKALNVTLARDSQVYSVKLTEEIVARQILDALNKELPYLRSYLVA